MTASGEHLHISRDRSGFITKALFPQRLLDVARGYVPDVSRNAEGRLLVGAAQTENVAQKGGSHLPVPRGGWCGPEEAAFEPAAEAHSCCCKPLSAPSIRLPGRGSRSDLSTGPSPFSCCRSSSDPARNGSGGASVRPRWWTDAGCVSQRKFSLHPGWLWPGLLVGRFRWGGVHIRPWQLLWILGWS